MHFLTVEWCKDGKRGVFCRSSGRAFSQALPHTAERMEEILGPFSMILSPESTELTVQELRAYCFFRPLAEYQNQYGIALTVQYVPIREATQ